MEVFAWLPDPLTSAPYLLSVKGHSSVSARSSDVAWRAVELEELLRRRISVRADLLVEEIDGECLVLDMESNVYFGLDAIGLFVWRQFENGLVGEDVVDLLVEEYGEALREQVEQDIRGFIESLYSAKLVVDSDTP